MLRTTLMNQLEDIVRFEEDERDRYLTTYFPFEEAKGYFPTLNEQGYLHLLADTKMGLRKGVQDHLQKADPASPLPSIYFIDVREFCLHNNLAQFIQSELRGKYEGYGDDYCREVGAGYGSFLYNYSLDEFRKKFATISPQRAYG